MAYSVVQQKEFSRNAAGQASIASGAFGASVTAANVLLIFAFYYSTASKTITMSGNSNSFAEIGTGLFNGSAGAGVRAYVVQSANSGTTQMTATFGANVDYPAIAVVEISGLATSSVVGGSVFVMQAAPGTASNAVTTGNVTPSGQPAAIFGIANDLGNQASPAAGTGYTGLTPIFNYEGTATAGGRIEHKRVTATTATPATWTTDVNGGPDNYLNVAVVLLEPGAGGGGTTPITRDRRSGSGGMKDMTGGISASQILVPELRVRFPRPRPPDIPAHSSAPVHAKRPAFVRGVSF